MFRQAHPTGIYLSEGIDLILPEGAPHGQRLTGRIGPRGFPVTVGAQSNARDDPVAGIGVLSERDGDACRA